MEDPPSHLLEPVLDESRASEPLFSNAANFWVAFLGGPFALLGFSWLNTKRLGRQSEDLWLYVLCAVLSIVGFAVVVGYAIQSDPALSADDDIWSAIGSHRREIRFVPRLMGVALYGVFFFLYRRFYKAAAMYRQEHPSPWSAGIGAVVLGGVLQFGVLLVLFFSLRSL